MISVLVLWPVYIVAVQYLRGGWWRLLAPFTFVALVLDVVLNYTELALLTWDWPRDRYEVTFSNRLKRLVARDDWRGKLARYIATKMLNPYDPTGTHVAV